MGRTTTNRMSHVISCRVSEPEMLRLQREAEKAGVSITMLLRQCLNLPEPNQQAQTNCG